MTINPTRLEDLIVARAFSSKQPVDARGLSRDLRRFAPTDADEPSWRGSIEAAVASLRAAQVLDAAGRLGDLEELGRRIGPHTARTWPHLADKVLPAVALGVPPDDAKSLSRLKDRDAWAAAIVARSLGLWKEGPPPSLPVVCDAFVWRSLGLAGKPGRCPPAVRALFLQRELATEPGPPDRLMRLMAARDVGAPRAELRALRDGLIRRWLQEDTAPASSATPPAPAFATEVREVAQAARDGVFGDRKVFISTVWQALRERGPWVTLALDDFKRRIYDAHRAGELVLARADLVAAMDPERVAASETEIGGATFHFIVREAT